MSSPITNPGLILSSALYGALSPLVGSVDGIPAVYWQRAPGAAAAQALLNRTLPGCLAVTAPADLVGAGWIGESTVEAPLLLKAFATTDDGAQALLQQAVAALGAGHNVTIGLTTYRVALEWRAEVPLPETGGIATAAARYRAELRRA